MRRLVLIALFALVLTAPVVFSPAPAEASSNQQQTVHIVQPGDTLYSIANKYGVSAASIAQANGLVNPDYIYVGQRLVIPGSYHPGTPGYPPSGSCTHVVALGETLSGIAWQYGTTVAALMQANGISNPDYIYAGQTLTIPGCGNPPGPGPAPSPGPGPCGSHYIVRHGDTLSGIAFRHGTTVNALANANGLHYPYVIYPGQRLYVPCGTSAPGPGHPDHGKPGKQGKPVVKPKLEAAACARNIQIVEPKVGEHLHGTVQIIGSASIDDFQFYKLEYAMGHNPLDSEFHSINEVYTTAVWDSVLGTWFVGNMPAGAYTLRLTAVDNRGQFPRPCDVDLYIGD
ncbi:MAG: LysM peptidoglycan-binding domain-containing protein [Anaerolineae bacterium]